ncbi:thiosulfate dehydrogenase [Flavobacterium gillisiae]|uniref:Thiosulfate dehydrogenase n=1 Tax=Flavobacterium gillisiae TaxID=150146 RepID=A0A1H4F691_9FLAO|nr:c-type cytochrome [Flavobacterium gillisiae]SEA92875.1 thiosulfate dehydrogenase [Flavobacterium gillisiae]
MKKNSIISLIAVLIIFILNSCNSSNAKSVEASAQATDADYYITIDASKIPNDKFGESVRYGRELMLRTAYYIGPNGINGKYLGNKMNCTNCHQDAGTKPYSFNLITTNDNYPQFRGREGKVLTLAERVNNCVMHPHNGRPLPLDSKEMVAFLSYYKWINSFVSKDSLFNGAKSIEISFPDIAASPERGKALFIENCVRCHGIDGQGQYNADKSGYVYPPLWGEFGYQPGSSMHRIIKQARWLKANMPYDKVTLGKPYLTDTEALDIAAYVNDDSIHERPNAKTHDIVYPDNKDKSIDYDKGPFVDIFSETQHKYGPYQPIIGYWKKQGWKPVY